MSEIERIYNSIKNDTYFSTNEHIREYISNNPEAIFDVNNLEDFNPENVLEIHLCKDNTDTTDGECAWYRDMNQSDKLIHFSC